MASSEWLSPRLLAGINFRLYRYRFLMTYTVIGVLALCAETVVFRALLAYGVTRPAGIAAGVTVSVIVAYWLNARFNFKVPVAKRRRALRYFVVISLGALSLNFALTRQFAELGWSYERGRFTSAGLLFLIGYYFHRRYSFRDAKQVGVAIYADRNEDIRGIWQKVGSFPSFIHVDLVDETFREGSPAPFAARLEVVRALWPDKQLDVHVMSRTPLRWLDDILPHCDTVILHCEAGAELEPAIARVHAAGRKAAIALALGTPSAAARPYLDHIEMLMLLSIPSPGMSGQRLSDSAIESIAEINGWPERRRLVLCVDGGVNERNISLLNVEKVVSGSSVLGSADPRRQIMRLQTSSNYESI